jgi:agmatine/peptidylarginine deiminase
VYKKAFGADDVLVLGEGKPQPAKIFHIDQAVFFPEEGVAILSDLKGDVEKEADKPREKRLKDVEDTLAVYEKQLRAAGFKIIKIPTTAAHVDNFQSYANSIPLTNGGKTKIIMPSFPASTEIENEIRSILQKNGYDVVFIEDKAYERKGNLHCLTGALAIQDTRKATPQKTGRG